MQNTSLKFCLQTAHELQHRVLEGDDCLIYQAELSQLGTSIESWIASKQTTGLLAHERLQLEQVLSLFQSIHEHLSTQRKALHAELFQLNSAKKVATTYSP